MSIDKWKKIVANDVAQFLKLLGFRKSGSNFSLSRPEAELLVSLQSSTSSTKDSLRITCNLAIRVELLATDPDVSVWGAHWRQRLGFFLSEPRDHWWVCASDDEARQCGKEIVSLLRDRGFPAMEKLGSLAALAELWSSGRSPGLTESQRAKNLAKLISPGIDVASARQ